MTVHPRFRLGFDGQVNSDSRVCNCACSRCMSGGCCMDPAPPSWGVAPNTVSWDTTTLPAPFLCAAGHDFAVFDVTAIYCRRCGAFREAVLRPEPKEG